MVWAPARASNGARGAALAAPGTPYTPHPTPYTLHPVPHRVMLAQGGGRAPLGTSSPRNGSNFIQVASSLLGSSRVAPEERWSHWLGIGAIDDADREELCGQPPLLCHQLSCPVLQKWTPLS